MEQARLLDHLSSMDKARVLCEVAEAQGARFFEWMQKQFGEYDASGVDKFVWFFQDDGFVVKVTGFDYPHGQMSKERAIWLHAREEDRRYLAPIFYSGGPATAQAYVHSTGTICRDEQRCREIHERLGVHDRAPWNHGHAPNGDPIIFDLGI